MNIFALLDHCKTVQASDDAKNWYPARPCTAENTFLRLRLRAAWKVLRGEADMVEWSIPKHLLEKSSPSTDLLPQEGKRPNWTYLGPRDFIAWTQAGFKHCVRHLQESEKDFDPVVGYPTSYPSHVVFVPRSYNWVAHCTPLKESINRYKSKHARLVQLMEDHFKK